MNPTQRIPLRRLAPLTHENLAAAYFSTVEKTPNSFACMDAQMRFTRLEELRFAAALSRVSGEFGERVGVVIPSSVAAASFNLALLLGGRVPLNLNMLSGKEQADHLIQKCGITHVVGIGRMLKILKPAATTIAIEDLVQEASTPSVSQWAKETIDADATTRALAFPGLKKELQDMLVLLATTGSTGNSKAVILSHRAILSNIQAVRQHYGFTDKDRLLCSGPPNHALWWTSNFAAAVIGIERYYAPNPLATSDIFKMIVEHAINLVLSVPTLMAVYLKKGATREIFQTVTQLILGAEPLPEELGNRIEEILGIVPDDVYGSTEFGGIGAASKKGKVLLDDNTEVEGYAPRVAGLPMPGIVAEVRDPETDRVLPRGELGLLYLDGPSKTDGYLAEPEKTEEVLRGGWYNTGDLAYIDALGRVVIVDRYVNAPKIGGDMVPVGRSREVMLEMTGMAADTLYITFIPDPDKGSRLIVLYTADLAINQEMVPEKMLANGVPPATPDTIAAMMRATGMMNAAIPKTDAFFRIDKFPMSAASNKLDIKELKVIAKREWDAHSAS